MKHGNTDPLSRYVLRPGVMNAEAARALRLIPHDLPGDCVEWLTERVSSGKSELREIFDESGRATAGVLVFAVDDMGDGAREFVVQAVIAKSECALSPYLDDKCTELAHSLGCQTIRLHTMRPGLVQNGLRRGWHVSEVVMRKKIAA